MKTGSEITGRGDARLIVCTPGPLMLKLIVSRPPELGLLLAALIASRNVQLLALQTPSSVSAAEVTTNIVAPARAARLKTQASPIIRLNICTSLFAVPRRSDAGREPGAGLESPNRLSALAF